MADQILHAPVTPIPGVPETLAELARRYRLGLVTKGDRRSSARNLAGRVSRAHSSTR